MKENPFIARCSIVLFLCSILVPPLLYLFAHNSPGSESIIGFFFFASLTLSFIFAILSRDITISKVSLFGTPLLVILLCGLVMFNLQRSTQLRKEHAARIEAIKKKEMVEQGAAANP
jgi:hypothetical protein